MVAALLAVLLVDWDLTVERGLLEVVEEVVEEVEKVKMVVEMNLLMVWKVEVEVVQSEKAEVVQSEKAEEAVVL